MASLRWTALASLGITFCIGCGDSQSQWESKSESSAHKKIAVADDAKGNDAAPSSGDADNPQPGMNPHSGMERPAEGASEPLENNGTLDVDTAHWTVPKSWVRKTPKMPNFIKAEYAIPKAEGDKADGRLTVSAAGGDVESNITRWKGQFGEKPDKEKQETIDAGGIKITLVDLTGTFSDSMGGPMAPAISRPDYRMLGAIFQVPGDDTLHFVKCYGPKKTISEHADEFKGFLESLKVDK